MDELSSYIARLEDDLKEVDAMLAAHAYTIDKKSPSGWPERSTLGKAIKRHTEREAKRMEMLGLLGINT